MARRTIAGAGCARSLNLGFDLKEQDQVGWRDIKAQSGSLTLQEDEHSLACTKVSIRRHAHSENAPEPEREGPGQIT